VSGAIPIEASLGPDLQDAVDRRLRAMGEDEVVPRIWARDHTVWRDDPTEIADRLGWLTAPHAAPDVLPEVRTLAEQAVSEGLTHAVLLGMGGSSLAPEVLREITGIAPGALDLRVLDTTHPDAIAAVEREVPLDRALFLVASKSGTTIETRSHLAYFMETVGRPDRFVAITDPGTPLEKDARAAGFRQVFSSPPDVGGRYSALTVFGLVPAALIGADLEALLSSAVRGAAACGGGVPVPANPGAVLGAIIGEAALAGRDKLSLHLEGTLEAMGPWVEQLVAESTGKDGVGILPVDAEPPEAVAAAGRDRVFVSLDDALPPEPWARLPLGEPTDLGAAFFVLEFATAVAGHILGIQPFDQPDVQAAKDRTQEVLSAGDIPPEPPGDLAALLSSVRPGDYVAIQAFVPPGPEVWRGLQAARGTIGGQLGVATTLGYGPRYLHSTGQLHKGGPPTGVFVQVFEEPTQDRPVPGAPYTFGRLVAAQATGDLAALRDRGRRVARIAMRDLLAWTG
jgi:transaldolase/glucose-6-phosphate isomerase